MRSPPGAGSIERLPSGSYRLTLRVQGRRIRATFETREAAERQLAALRYEIQAAGLDAMAPVTVRAFGTQWLARRKNRNALDDASKWQCHIAGDPLGDRPLEELDRQELREWLQRLLEKPGARGKPLSRQTVRHCLNLLRRALQDAVEEELLTANPAADVRLPGRDTQTEETWTFLTTEEIERLFRQPLPPATRAAFAVAIYTALRQGEIIGLHWDDVVLEGPRPHLRVRLSHRGPTKGGRIRRVPLLEPARQALAAWQPECPPSRLGLVFPGDTGEPHSRGYDWDWADRKTGRPSAPVMLGWKTRAGILRPVRFHDLRHTCASHLIMGTWGPPFTLSEVREVLGHSSSQLTERYAHLSPDHLLTRAASLRFPPAQ